MYLYKYIIQFNIYVFLLFYTIVLNNQITMFIRILKIKVTILSKFILSFNILLFINIILAFNNLVYGQDVLPEVNFYYNGDDFQTYSIPSIKTTDKQFLNTNYSSYTGIRKVVFSSFINYCYLNKLEKSNWAMGANLLYTQFGDFHNISQYRGMFAYKINFSKEFNMIQSANLGITNFAIGSTNTTGGYGSAFNPDISIGNYITYKKISWGNSLNHILNLKFRPIYTSFSYNRKFCSLFSYTDKFSFDRYENRMTLLFTHNLYNPYNENKNSFVFTEEVSFYSRFKLIGNIYNLELLGIGSGYNFKNNNWTMGLDLVFYTAIKPTGVNSNRYQFKLNFCKL